MFVAPERRPVGKGAATQIGVNIRRPLQDVLLIEGDSRVRVDELAVQVFWGHDISPERKGRTRSSKAWGVSSGM